MAEKHHTDRNRALERWSSAAGPVLLFLIVIGFFWRLTLTSQYTWLENAETANRLLPTYQFLAGVWHAHQIPFWDPFVSGGQPVFARAEGAAYPPNWLLFLAPLRGGWIRQSYLHWYFVLIHFQAALFGYWLCRDLKRSQAASLLAGLAFALGGFLGTASSPAVVNAALWAPLILLFFLRIIRGERPMVSAAWSGTFLGMAFLSGDPQIPIFLCLMMAGLWGYHLAQNQKDLKLLLIFSLFAILVGSLQTFPQYWNGSPAQPTSYAVQRDSSLYPQSLLGIVIPGFFRKGDPFVGLTGLCLAILGIITGWQDRVVRMVSAVALAGLLYALGSNSVFQGILYSVVPAIGKSTVPSTAIFLFHFGICVLIAFGLDGYRSLAPSSIRPAVWLLCGFSAVIGLIVWVLMATRTAFDERLGMVFLAGLLLAGIFSGRAGARLTEQATVLSLGFVMLLELGNVTTYAYPALEQGTPFLKKLSEDSDIANFLNDQTGPVRVAASEKDIPYDFGDWYGIDYFPASRARGIDGVNFEIAQAPSRPNLVEVFQGKSGLRVYRDPEAFPRAWVVHEIVTENEPHFDPRRQAIVNGPPPRLEGCREAGTADLAARQANYVAIQVNLMCRGMLVESDAFGPGWEASVDGRPTTLYAVDGWLRGVVVEPGGHRVEMRYRPKPVYWGASLTAFGLLAAGALARRTDAGH